MKIYFRVFNLIQLFFYGAIHQVALGKNVFLKGRAYIFKTKTSHIVIGNNTLLNSSNYGYHINMHSPCKLIADGVNSEITIGSNSRIHGTCIHAQRSIKIGNNNLIAANCQIIDSDGHELSMSDSAKRIYTAAVPSSIVFSDNVWIGANCIILPGTQIGAGSVVCAGSVVKGIFPEKVLIGGNPATILKTYQ